MWPVSTPDAFVELFHLGLWPSVDRGRGIRLPVGVAEPSREGVERVDIRGVRRGGWLADDGVREDCVWLEGWGRWLPILDDRCFADLALLGFANPSDDMITDEGGEL